MKTKQLQHLPFIVWMGLIDKAVSKKLFGLSTADLPDLPYRDWYDQGWFWKSVFEIVIREEY